MSYNDLVNIPTFEKRKADFNPERGEVTYYCKDCGKTVEAIRVHPQKYRYECPECKGKNISLGTEESLKDFYRKK